MDHKQKLIEAVQLSARKLASHARLDQILPDVLGLCVEAVGAEAGTIYLHEPEESRLGFAHVIPDTVRNLLPKTWIEDTYGLAGEAFQTRRTIVKHFGDRTPDQYSSFEKATGIPTRTMIVTPLTIVDEQPIGVVQLINKLEGNFDEVDQSVLEIIASVCTMGFLNAKLLEESARASTLLGMGSVGHDIGNLATSILYPLQFCEFLSDRLRKEPAVKVDRALNDQTIALHETLSDARASADRIVGYSKLLSDLSAGRTLRPELATQPLDPIIEEAVLAYSGQANQMGINLVYKPCITAPSAKVDRLYLLRIVQNLVGNALKAVLEVGPAAEHLVEVEYQFDKELGHVIRVRDSGPGMPPAMIKRILSGTAGSRWDKSSGSGWGTRIVLELATALGGRVEIDSQAGLGSIFTVFLPK